MLEINGVKLSSIVYFWIDGAAPESWQSKGINLVEPY